MRSRRKNGALGKTGKVNLRINYLKVGDHRTGTQAVTVVLVGVFAGFVKGKNVTIPRGATINAFADQDTVLETPIAPPPAEL